MTPELIEHLKREEGWRAKVYRCPAGYPTIGYGHRVPDMGSAPLSPERGEALLIEDIEHYEAMALRLSPGLKDESPRRLAAITDFCFNAGGNAYTKSVLRVKVNQKKWDEAAAQMMRWVYATHPVTKKKFVFQGLVRRRTETAKWLREG